MKSLITKLPTLVGNNLADSVVIEADEFTYHDPVDQSVSEHQGIRILLENESRIYIQVILAQAPKVPPSESILKH